MRRRLAAVALVGVAACSFAPRYERPAAPVPGAANRLRARTSAADQTLRTALKADGVQVGIDRSGADTATFESKKEVCPG